MAAITIHNSFITATINSYGAELTSLKKKFGSEVLWQADRNVWPRHAPVLFPIVGRLKSNKFTYHNAEYSLAQHGFARDNEFVVIEQSPTSAAFELTANEDTLKSYPFHFSLIISYELKDDQLLISYRVLNPDNKDLYFSIGAHPGFSCKQVADDSLANYYLEFSGINTLTIEKLNDGLLQNECYDIELENSRLPLSVALFENDALVLKNNQINSVKLCSTKSNSSVEMICKNWPYFGIWTKKGSDAFVCLEPWFGITDSIGHQGNLLEKEGIIHLTSLHVKTFEFIIKLI